jgi:opacity protein-like surface antigen
MKRTIVALLFLVLATLSARAQVVPSATGSKVSVTVGGLGSVSQPDYAGGLIAQTSPNRLYGIGAYVDVRVNRWVQLEGEARWMRFNEYSWGSPALVNGEDTYLIGPRLPIRHFGRATPYGKVLAGLGTSSFLENPAFALAYGGGVDYRLTKRFSARADFEYQQWRVTPNLYPYGASVGIGYKIF